MLGLDKYKRKKLQGELIVRKKISVLNRQE